MLQYSSLGIFVYFEPRLVVAKYAMTVLIFVNNLQSSHRPADRQSHRTSHSVPLETLRTR